MAISTEEVDKIAKLARLSFNDEQKQKFTQELSQILDYVGQINSLSEKVATDATPENEINRMRDDVAESLTPPADLIKLSPQSQDEFYKVKSVF